MKKIILLIGLLSLNASLPAQDVCSISYTYEMSTPPLQTLDTNQLKQQFGELDQEALNEALTLSKEFQAFSRNLVEHLNQQILTYYYADTTVVLERKLDKESEDEYILIHPQSGRKTIYYTHKGGWVNWVTSKIFNQYTPWEVTFEIDSFLTDRKLILGYDCYKVVVLEKRKNPSEPESLTNSIHTRVYEMYVTDELSLPADIVCGAWAPKIRFSALEIKGFDLGNPS